MLCPRCQGQFGYKMRAQLDLMCKRVVSLSMSNYSHAASQSAKQAVKAARYMQWDAEANGYGLMPLVGFYRLARAMAVAADQVDEDSRKADRWQRVQRGMVANHISDMRAVGSWDGE